MKVSPLDIRKQEFARSIRGYDVEEVQAFLRMISQEWGQVLEQQHQVKTQIDELKARLEHYQRVEEALQAALKTARENAAQALDQAKQEGERLIEEAQKEADAIRTEAIEEVADAGKQAEQIVQDARLERDQILSEISELSERRDGLVVELQNFLRQQMDDISNLGGKRSDGGKMGKVYPMPSAEPNVENPELDDDLEETPAATLHSVSVDEEQDVDDEMEVDEEIELWDEEEETIQILDPVDYEEDEEDEVVDEAEDDEPSDQPDRVDISMSSTASMWRVRELVSEVSEAGKEATASDEPEEELDEMQKIRRILDELDDK